MTKIIYWIYLKLIRKWSSPLIYWVVRKFIYNGELPPHWGKIKDYDIEEFEDYIMKYGYRWDYKFGIIDFSLQEPNFFFKSRKWFRDCDDWSKLWYLWAKNKGYKVYEVCVWNGFEKSHFVTVFEKDEKYHLCNYYYKGNFDNLKKAVKSIDGYADWLIYKESDK